MKQTSSRKSYKKSSRKPIKKYKKSTRKYRKSNKKSLRRRASRKSIFGRCEKRTRRNLLTHNCDPLSSIDFKKQYPRCKTGRRDRVSTQCLSRMMGPHLPPRIRKN